MFKKKASTKSFNKDKNIPGKTFSMYQMSTQYKTASISIMMIDVMKV